jgi:hypothetical protein
LALVFAPDFLPVCEIVECDTVLVDVENLFGAVLDAWLVLQRPLKRGAYHVKSSSRAVILWDTEVPQSQDGRNQLWSIYLDAAEDPVEGVAEFLVVSGKTIKEEGKEAFLTDVHGLVLQSVTHNTYRRIGLFISSDAYDRSANEFSQPDIGMPPSRRFKIV